MKNFEMYKTAEERIKAFKIFCNENTNIVVANVCETNLEEWRYDIGHDVSGRCSVTYTPVIGHILIENSNVILTN